MIAVQTDIHKDTIEKSKKGNSRAQYRLYQLYAKAMYNTCYRMMNNRMEAEDMLQEAFSDAFRKLDSFRYDSTFGAWLKRIVVNKCINEIKRKKVELSFVEDISVFHIRPEEDDAAAELKVDDVRKAMEQLPDGSRLIFSLYLLEGYDHREIARILNTSESNSKSQYMRAKRKVKEILERGSYEKR